MLPSGLTIKQIKKIEYLACLDYSLRDIEDATGIPKSTVGRTLKALKEVRGRPRLKKIAGVDEAYEVLADYGLYSAQEGQGEEGQGQDAGQDAPQGPTEPSLSQEDASGSPSGRQEAVEEAIIALLEELEERHIEASRTTLGVKAKVPSPAVLDLVMAIAREYIPEASVRFLVPSGPPWEVFLLTEAMDFLKTGVPIEIEFTIENASNTTQDQARKEEPGSGDLLGLLLIPGVLAGIGVTWTLANWQEITEEAGKWF